MVWEVRKGTFGKVPRHNTGTDGTLNLFPAPGGLRWQGWVVPGSRLGFHIAVLGRYGTQQLERRERGVCLWVFGTKCWGLQLEVILRGGVLGRPPRETEMHCWGEPRFWNGGARYEWQWRKVVKCRWRGICRRVRVSGSRSKVWRLWGACGSGTCVGRERQRR